jgi:hypothetical protein
MHSNAALNGHDSSLDERFLLKHLSAHPLEIDGVSGFIEHRRNATTKSMARMLRGKRGLTSVFRSVHGYVLNQFDAEDEITLADVARVQRSQREFIANIIKRTAGDMTTPEVRKEMIIMMNGVFLQHALSEPYVDEVVAGDFQPLATAAYEHAMRRNVNHIELPPTLSELCIRYITDVTNAQLTKMIYPSKKKEAQPRNEHAENETVASEKPSQRELLLKQTA